MKLRKFRSEYETKRAARLNLAVALLWPLLALAGTAPAQQALNTDNTPAATAPAMLPGGADLLSAALACRLDDMQLPDLLPRLRRERPQDFTQAERQYANPDMDLYRLADPANAWGQRSDAVIIAANRVLLAIPGDTAEITARVDAYFGESLLPDALDAHHALLVYQVQQPGLQDMTLIGCEYQVEGLSLLDDPADDWRKRPAPGSYARTEPLR
ncbi:MAG: hypothetical protein QM769_09125 [Pseudoxanthomonas sp.]